MYKNAAILREKQSLYELIAEKENIEEVMSVELKRLERLIEEKKRKITELLEIPQHNSLFE